VKGSRLAVEYLIELLARGWTEEQILGNHPGMTSDDLRACLAYAHEEDRGLSSPDLTEPVGR